MTALAAMESSGHEACRAPASPSAHQHSPAGHSLPAPTACLALSRGSEPLFSSFHSPKAFAVKGREQMPFCPTTQTPKAKLLGEDIPGRAGGWTALRLAGWSCTNCSGRGAQLC